MDSTEVQNLNNKLISINLQLELFKNENSNLKKKMKLLYDTNTNIIVENPTSTTDTIYVYTLMDTTFIDTLSYSGKHQIITTENDTLSFNILYQNKFKTYYDFDNQRLLISQDQSHQLKDLKLIKHYPPVIIDKKDLFNVYLSGGILSTSKHIGPMLGVDLFHKETHSIGAYIGDDKYFIKYGFKLF